MVGTFCLKKSVVPVQVADFRFVADFRWRFAFITAGVLFRGVSGVDASDAAHGKSASGN
jgi:hypothetical protein